jgi:hypothetical protein
MNLARNSKNPIEFELKSVMRVGPANQSTHLISGIKNTGTSPKREVDCDR